VHGRRRQPHHHGRRNNGRDSFHHGFPSQWMKEAWPTRPVGVNWPIRHLAPRDGLPVRKGNFGLARCWPVRPVVMRYPKGACAESWSRVRRDRRVIRPAMANSRRRSRLGSQTRGVGAGQREHLHPSGQLGREHDDRDPHLVLRKVM
jgi:hypothetical protein